MSTTERLRKLLDDCGADWDALSDTQQGENTITATRWHDSEGNLLTMCIDKTSGSTWDFFWLPTPEQAIEATLGRGTCKAKLYKPEHGSSDCTICECGEINDISANYCNRCGRRIKVVRA